MPPNMFAGTCRDTPIDLTTSPQRTMSKKRKSEQLDTTASSLATPRASTKRRRGDNEESWPGADEHGTPSKRKTPRTPSSSSKKQTSKKDDSPEKRPKRFRPAPPQDFHVVYERALGQRFYVLGRRRVGTELCPGEEVQMTGSTGNVYTVTVGPVPVCNCPHAVKGNQCKHVLYVMSRVLHAPYHLVYQRGLLSSELCEIFASAPPVAGSSSSSGEDAASSQRRKPVEGDCPICFCELDGDSPETIVWCKAACGQNIHQECFEQWAKTKPGKKVTCPFCRSVWEGDEDMVGRVNVGRGRMSEGYLNVGDQLGISGERDMSSYSTWFTGWGGGWQRRRGRDIIIDR